MRVLNYLELEDHLGPSGIRTAVRQQRSALQDAGVTVVDTLTQGGPTSATQSALSGQSPTVDYDLAHVNTVGPGSVAVATHALRTGRPLVVHAHVTREDFRDSFRGSNALSVPLGRYLRWFYSRADLVLCPSEYTRSLLEQYPVTTEIRPMTNGVDIADLAGHATLREPTRETYDLSGTVVFTVGHVYERKGLSTFCELAQATDYTYAWFGPYRTDPLASSTVKRHVRSPPENVTFTGWVEDRRSAFAAGDIYFFPSKAENQGIAVLEAMATGNPVVARDIPVFREYFTDGEDIVLCESGEEFRAAIDRLADDPALRERLAKNARETAVEHSLDRVGDLLVSTYRDLLDRV
ncbi:glycosyltransferase family 4 protein [Halococcoides cellulosivorans]|uniref:Glycosyl transferase family 1 n=1 Tax=Halococcoides cellulosivorans TaxID=1679096 RepID=A0A2R4X2W0_9EURY|nr:glycosyltransferase family 4 protein [Halococcoides cellulosivorans]AWB28130.1 glycosyl transferase family 1 [Halococcoides cellulosivorans]